MRVPFCVRLYHLYHAEHAVRRDQHDDARRDDAAENRQQRARFGHFQQRCDQRTRPRAVSGSGTATNRYSPRRAYFCDLAAFAQRLSCTQRQVYAAAGVFPPYNSFSPVRAAAEWEHIAGLASPGKASVTGFRRVRAPTYCAAQLYERHHGNDKNGRLAPRAEQPVK